MDERQMMEFLRTQYGIKSIQQLDEEIRRMKKIDIGIFTGKAGANGSSNSIRESGRRSDDRSPAIGSRV